jgi:hypothetical protein
MGMIPTIFVGLHEVSLAINYSESGMDVPIRIADAAIMPICSRKCNSGKRLRSTSMA